MNWLRKIIEDDNTNAEKSMLGIVAFLVAIAFGVCALLAYENAVTLVEAFLWFSAACMGIGAIGGILNRKNEKS